MATRPLAEYGVDPSKPLPVTLQGPAGGGAPSAFTSGQVSVGTGAAVLIKASNTSRYELLVVNVDTVNPVYLGPDNTVTSTTGAYLGPGSAVTFRNTGAIYGRATGGTVTVTYAEE